MDVSHDEIVREAEEEFGFLQSGVRFHPEKRRIEEESPSVIGTENYDHKVPSDPIVMKGMTKIPLNLRKDQPRATKYL